MSDLSDDSPPVRRVAPAGVVMAATMLPPPEGGTPLDSPEPLGNSPPSIATADVLRSKVAGKSRSRQGSGLVSMTAEDEATCQEIARETLPYSSRRTTHFAFARGWVVWYTFFMRSTLT